MKRTIASILFGTALLALPTLVDAESLTVNSILVAHKSGATADGVIAMVNNPANSIVATAEDLVTLRTAGVPETVLTAVAARVALPVPPAVPAQPDDARLVDLVRLSQSGISESIVVEQVRQSGRAFNLSVTDLLYLKQNGIPESMIGSLMATQDGTQAVPPTVAAGAPVPAGGPQEMTFQDLVLVRPSFGRKSRPGRLVLKGDSFSWVDGSDPKQNFDFQVNGLKKVWYTCQARTPENFCYQINFQIVKGAKYRFLDVNEESGSNASVVKVMDALRLHFPRLAYGPPDA